MCELAGVARSHVDVVRTLLVAEAAVVAGSVFFGDVEKLELRLRVEDLQQVADDAECAEKYRPRDVGSEYICNIIKSEQDADPHPELQ